jgi:hypothetical protein
MVTKSSSLLLLTTCPLKKLFIASFPQPSAHHQLESSLLLRSANQIQHILLIAYFLPYIRLSKVSNQYMFTLKMATAIFAEMLDNFQHLMWLIHES